MNSINQKSSNLTQMKSLILFFFLSFFLHLVFTLPLSGPQMSICQIPVGEQRSWTDTKKRASLNLWSAECHATARDNTGQNTKVTHPVPG